MKFIFKILVLLVLLFTAFIVDLKTGSIDFSFSELFSVFFNRNTDTQTYLILKEFRLPRVLTAILVGVSLPLSGLLLQTLFKNPLAGPYILGISSGASLGVAVFLLGVTFIGITAVPAGVSLSVAGIIGAFFVLAIILSISLKIGNNTTILIIGVFLGSGISAIVNLLQYFSSAPMLKKFVIWTMGSLDAVMNDQLWYFSLIVLISIILLVVFSKYFDTIYLGEDNAKTLGVDIKLLKILILIVTGILTGVTTSLCGPIGFIGIAVPHLSRIIFKTYRHLELIIYSSLIGATLMLFSDAVSHSFSNQVVPINTITSIVGIPIIFWIVFKGSKY